MIRRVPFARRNFTHRKVRTAVALAGVTFAVLLVFMQLGFYFAVLTSCTALYRAMPGEIFLTSPRYVHIGQSYTIPRQRLYQAASIDGVRDVAPLYTATQLWRNAETKLRFPLLVIGVDPNRNPLSLSINAPAGLRDGQVFIDSLTRPQLGPHQRGIQTAIGSRQITVTGEYRIGPGFAADGDAIMTDDTFVRLFKHRRKDQISIGILHLSPDTDAMRVAEVLRRRLPADTMVFTRAEMIAREENYWKELTSIGPVFALGAVLGLVIGVVVIYQVVVTDIANRIREYATLKGLGLTGRNLQRMVVREVSLFSVLGFGIAYILSAALYEFVSGQTGLPMEMRFARSFLIFLLAVAMCWTAGLLATRKLRSADPADLY
jgi:putative ABC transport system permease protein